MAVGRPSKLTKERIEDICSALDIGASLEIAANYAGVSYNTYLNWHKRGKAAIERLGALLDEREKIMAERSKRQATARKDGIEFDEPLPKTPKYTAEEKLFVEFFEETQAANAHAKIGWLQVIDNAANVDPVWSAWQLAHRDPEEYGSQRVQKHEITGKDGGKIETKATVYFFLPDNGRGDNLEEATDDPSGQ